MYFTAESAFAKGYSERLATLESRGGDMEKRKSKHVRVSFALRIGDVQYSIPGKRNGSYHHMAAKQFRLQPPRRFSTKRLTNIAQKRNLELWEMRAARKKERQGPVVKKSRECLLILLG